MRSRFVLIALLALPFSGCRGSLDAAKPPPTFVIAVDRSGSTDEMRESQKDQIFEVFRKAYEYDATFVVWAVDRDTQRIYGPRVPQEDRLGKEVYEQFTAGASETARQTRPALFWERMASEYASSSNSVRILFSTDGDNDWSGEESRVARAVEKLAGNPQVRIAVVNVKSKRRQWLDTAFSALGTRGDIAGPGKEADEAVGRLYTEGL